MGENMYLVSLWKYCGHVSNNLFVIFCSHHRQIIKIGTCEICIPIIELKAMDVQRKGVHDGSGILKVYIKRLILVVGLLSNCVRNMKSEHEGLFLLIQLNLRKVKSLGCDTHLACICDNLIFQLAFVLSQTI